MGPRLTKQQRAALAKVEAQTEQHNELMQAHIDRQARGLDPITGGRRWASQRYRGSGATERPGF
jgi:hypothetical protein